MSLVSFPRTVRSGRPGSSGSLLRPTVERLEDRDVPASLVSHPPAITTQGVDAPVTILGTSQNGNFVLLQSDATNLAQGQISPPGQTNLFLFTQGSSTVQLISAFPAGGGGVQAGFVKSLGVDPSIPGQQLNAVISEDGSTVAFLSTANAFQYDPTLAQGLSADGGGSDVFVWDRATGKVTLGSRTSKGQALGQFGQISNPSLSSDGKIVTFVSTASINDVVQQTEILPRSANTGNATAGSIAAQFNGPINPITFAPLPGTVSVGNPPDFGFRDDDGGPDLFRAVVGQTPEPISYHRVDMTFLVFQKVGTGNTSTLFKQAETHTRYFMDGDVQVDPLDRYSTIGEAGFVAIRTSLQDVFRYSYIPGDAATAIAGGVGADQKLQATPSSPAYTELDGVTSPGAPGAGRAGNAIMARVSGDILFTYQALNAKGALVTGYTNQNGGGFDLYRVKPSNAGSGGVGVDLVSAQFGTTNVGANGLLDVDPRAYQITDDGAKVLFTSKATNLVGGLLDNNATFDVFQRDMQLNVTSAISVTAANPLVTGNGPSRFPTQTPDSLVIGFQSDANNLTDIQDNNGTTDVFIRDIVQGDTLLASANASNTASGNNSSFGIFVTRTAQVNTSFFRRFLAFFSSNATDLDPNNPTIPPGITQVYSQSFPIFISQLARTFSYSGGANGLVAVARLDSNGNVITTSQFQPIPRYTGELRVASADVNGDGVLDVIVGTGAGVGPRVVVIDGFNGHTLMDFLAFEASFTGGVYVAGDDMTGDGRADVIVGAGEGGAPRVQIYDSFTGKKTLDQFAYESSARTGVRVAAGDFNGDGKQDLVVAAGIGGGPRVRVFSGATLPQLTTLADFFAFESGQRGGAYVSAGDFDGDGLADLVTGAGPEGGPRVIVWNSANLFLRDPAARVKFLDFFAFDPNTRNGVRAMLRNIDGDQFGDVVAGTGGGAPQIRTFLGGVVGGSTGTAPIGTVGISVNNVQLSPLLKQTFTPFNDTTGMNGAWVG
jgi:hypothetical protein